MKIIGKHKCGAIKKSKMRLFIWTTAPFLTTVFWVCVICNNLVVNNIINNYNNIIYKIFSNNIADYFLVLLSIICFIFVLTEIFILSSLNKQTRVIENKLDNSTYRFAELEFTEKSIFFKSFSYYASGDYVMPYEYIQKICFTKKNIYFFSTRLVLGLSRADMTETEETELIMLLKNKVSAEKFKPAKIPKRNTAKCQERLLIPEKQIVNSFPITSISHLPSTDDLKFALGFNCKKGKRIPYKKISVVCGIAALCFFSLGLVSVLLSIHTLDAPATLFFAISFWIFCICGLSHFSLKKSIEWSKEIAANRITISDYFAEWETVYYNGVVIKTMNNFAVFSNIAETHEYFVFTRSGSNIAVPKSVFENLDIVRQIFIKEMGDKYKHFPK